MISVDAEPINNTNNNKNSLNMSKTNNLIYNGSINDDKGRGLTLTMDEKEKGTLSLFYEDYYSELIKSSEYNVELDVANDADPGILNLIYRQLAMITLKENYFKLYTCIFGEKLNEIKKRH
jgi:hypothetical protein